MTLQRPLQRCRKNLLFVMCAIVVCIGNISLHAQTSTPQQTTFILIRHAEKAVTPGTNDPDLSAEGQKRAEKLATLFQPTPSLAGIYTTPYKRTTQTVQPLAQVLGLPVQQYAANSGEGFLDSLITKHVGKTVLIVGHSNTIPTLVNVLSGTNQYTPFDDADYSNIFIVTVVRRGNAAITRLRYNP